MGNDVLTYEQDMDEDARDTMPWESALDTERRHARETKFQAERYLSALALISEGSFGVASKFATSVLQGAPATSQYLEYLSTSSRSELAAQERMVERTEDMSRLGKIRLIQQKDGDITVAVYEEWGGLVSPGSEVKFCNSGGHSPNTLRALRDLMDAIEQDASQ